MKRQEFTTSVKEAAFERSGGICECGCKLPIQGRPDYDHYPKPAALGGPGTLDNCRVLDRKCHAKITREKDIPAIAKGKRIVRKSRNTWTRSRPMPGSRASGWRRKMDGTTERR